jgi:hypothetical protein
MSNSRHNLLHGVVMYRRTPALGLNNVAASVVFDDQVGTEVSAATDALYPVPLRGEKFLEQHLELGPGHSIDQTGPCA